VSRIAITGTPSPHRGGNPAHVADAAERAVQLVLLAAHDQELLLRVARTGHVVEVDLLELLQAGQPLGDGLEVGEHATQPAVVDVRHTDPGRLLGDGLLRLLLGPDEQDGPAVGDGLLDEVVGLVEVGQRLLQVDDVDAVALGHDEALHLGVPPAGLVPEVDAALQELAHGDDGHAVSRFLDRLQFGPGTGDGPHPAPRGGGTAGARPDIQMTVARARIRSVARANQAHHT
jgi:hypothetical protein